MARSDVPRVRHALVDQVMSAYLDRVSENVSVPRKSGTVRNGREHHL
jgi:hypothetical protein